MPALNKKGGVQTRQFQGLIATAYWLSFTKEKTGRRNDLPAL
jgi:hypothetical protein